MSGEQPYCRPLAFSVDSERQFGAIFYLLYCLTVAPAVVTTYAVPADPCLGIPFIQADTPPIVLSVNVTTDPCPTAVWTKDGGAVPATGVTVSLPGFSISHYILPLYPSRKFKNAYTVPYCCIICSGYLGY